MKELNNVEVKQVSGGILGALVIKPLIGAIVAKGIKNHFKLPNTNFKIPTIKMPVINGPALNIK